MRYMFLITGLLLFYFCFLYAKGLGCQESLPYTYFARAAKLFDVKASCEVNLFGDTIVVLSDGKNSYKFNLKTGEEINE